MDVPSGPGPSGPRTDSPAPEAVRAVLEDGEIHLHVPYPSPLLLRVRTLPGRRWDPGLRVWRMPDSVAGREAVRTVLGIEVDAPAPEPRAGALQDVHPAFRPRPGKPLAPRSVEPRVGSCRMWGRGRTWPPIFGSTSSGSSVPAGCRVRITAS